MIATRIILSIILVAQILKIIIKTSIINKNLIDHCMEYIVTVIVFVVLYLDDNISLKASIIASSLGLIYLLISSSFMYYKYIKKERINDFSIKKVIDTSAFGILVLKGKKRILINSTMYELLNTLNIKKDYIQNIVQQSIEQVNENYILKVDNKYYLFAVNKNEVISFDITEEYNLQKELNAQNEKISSNNKELVKAIENIEELEKEKSLLKLKNRYHDVLRTKLIRT